MRMSRPDFTLLIPLYNEEECLIPNMGQLLRFLRARGLEAQIILGSNGSTDNTVLIGKLLEGLSPGRITFFHLPCRGAVGSVFKEALKLADSPYIVSMDADLSVDLEFIPRSLALFRDFDIVVGSKQSGCQARSLVRRFGSGLFILCAQMLLRMPYNDYSIGAKAYRTEIFDEWQDRMSDDTNYVMDILLRCGREGRRIAVLPVECSDWRKSRFRLLGEAFVKYSRLFHLCFNRYL